MSSKAGLGVATLKEAAHLHFSSGNVANAIGTATIPAVVSVLNWLTGFEVTASGATAGLPVIVTIAGLLGGTQSWIFTFAVGVLVPSPPLVVLFEQPIPASATNIAIVGTLPASGAGGTNAIINLHGFRT